MMIPPKTKKRVKHNENEIEDRLSDLHDCILLHILSFLNTKHAVQTCVLSTRWKHLWKHLPILKLHYSEFYTFKNFTKFVSRVLSFRDVTNALHALDFDRKGSMEPRLLKRIVKYAISHNVQRLGLSIQCDIQHIPPCLFLCHTLTHLKLSVYHPRGEGYGETLFPKSLNLPALTGLFLENFAFGAGENGSAAEPFSSFKKLNSLYIFSCTVRGTITLSISSVTLVNLTMYYQSANFVKIELCAPSLRTFAFAGTPYQRLCGSKSNFTCVKEVDIDAEIFSKYVESPLILLSWLLYLSHIESLTVSASTLQVLSLFPNLVKAKLPFLRNLKSLKVKKKWLSYEFCTKLRDAKLQEAASKSEKEAAMLRKAYKAGFSLNPPLPDGIVDFLLQNSPYAEVDIIDCSRMKNVPVMKPSKPCITNFIT